MKKLKPLPKRIPKFKSYEEEANFWDTHDVSRLFREGKPAHVTFAKPMKHLISLRMDVWLLNELRELAHKRHLPYQTLMRSLLAEKLQEVQKAA